MKRELARTQRITIQLSRKEKRDAGTWVRVPDGTVSAVAVLEIDVDAVLRMLAEKSIRSKGGKAVMGKGAIVVKAIGRKRTQAGG